MGLTEHTAAVGGAGGLPVSSEDSVHYGIPDTVVDALVVRTADEELVLRDHREEAF